jgi:hypothetical protein
MIVVTNISFGQVILSPVAVTNATVTTYDNTVSLTNLINQSGITTPFTSGVTSFESYFANPGQVFATSGNGGTNNWQSELAPDFGSQGYIDFDLGAVYQIYKLALWNRSLSNITIKVLADLNGPEQTAGDFTLINRQSFTFSYAADVLPFPSPLEGRYLRLVINSIYPIPGFNFGYAALGEVVASVAPIEPARPVLSLVRAPTGDVIITFTGSLESSASVLGPFDTVSNNPPSPYTLLKTNLPPQQFFRAKGN